MNQRTVSLLGAACLDVGLGEGNSAWHPVALVGQALALAYRPGANRLRPAEQMVAGTGALLLATAGAAGAGWLVERSARCLGRSGAVLLPVALKPMFSIRQLLAEAAGVGDELEAGRLGAARLRLRALVSRPAAELGPGQIASAAVESVAENLCDSVAAPLLAFAIGGLPAAAAYRTVNTADAMFGYRDRLEWLGKAAARSDDALNWLPSRFATAGLILAAVLLLGPAAGLRSLRTAWRDAGGTASPNAGWPMAAMAGALGRRLEKPGHHVLGAGYPEPDVADVRRAVRVAGLAAALCVLGSALLAGRA